MKKARFLQMCMLSVPSTARTWLPPQAKYHSPFKQSSISRHPTETKWKDQTGRRLAEDLSLSLAPFPEGVPKEGVGGPISREDKDSE